MDKISDIKLKIIGELIKNRNYTRSLSNKLDIPKSTISDKLKEMYKQNIIDFKIQGRNKEYFIKSTFEAQNYIKMHEIYKLYQLTENYPNLKLIIKELINETNNELIILYGSYAKFNATKESDIDIYIVSKNTKLKEKLKLINTKLSIKIGKFNKNSLIGQEIIKNHIIIQNISKFQKIVN